MCPFQHSAGLEGRWSFSALRFRRIVEQGTHGGSGRRSLGLMFEVYGGDCVTEHVIYYVITLLQADKVGQLSLGWLDTPE
jgi:hypothetical protein